MTIQQCPITGSAVISEATDEDGRHLRWMQADPEIHVTRDLLEQADPEGLAFLEAAYELGEECPYDRRHVHARLRNGGMT